MRLSILTILLFGCISFTSAQETPKFTINDFGFSNNQDSTRAFIVFVFDGKNASTLKSSILSKLSSIYNSPKDVINKIGDNIISIDGYASRVFTYKDEYLCDILFTMTIEVKDNKVRYNNPVIRKMKMDSGIIGLLDFDENQTYKIIKESTDGTNAVLNFFNSLISVLNNSIKKGEDW